MKRNKITIIIIGLTILGFQNCSTSEFEALQHSFTENSREISNNRVFSQGISNDSEVLLPNTDSPTSIYVCPPGTKTSNSIPVSTQRNPPGVNTAYVTGISYGPGVSTVSATAGTTNGRTHVTLDQTGETNIGAVYQNGSNNTSAVNQTGTNNIACVVQIGDINNSAVNQTGQNNQAGVRQIGGQNSVINQNGQQTTGAGNGSPEACGCRPVECRDSNSDDDVSDCQEAATQKVI